MRKKSISIRLRMIISYMIVLLVPSIIIAAITYSAASQRVEQELMTSAQESVISADAIVSNTLDGKLVDLDYYGKLVTGNEVNRELADGGDLIKSKFQEYQALNKDVLNLYVGTNKGNTLMSSDEELPDDFDPRKRDWYVLALKSQKAVISPSYLSVDGNPVVSVSQVLADGSGVISMDLDLSAVASMTDMNVGKEGYIFIVDNSKKLLVHPTAEIGSESKDEYINKMFQNDSGKLDYTLQNKQYKMAYHKNEATGWRIGGVISKDEVTESTQDIRNTAFLVVILSVLGASVLIFMNVRSIVLPLGKLKEATGVLGKGDLTKKLGNFRGDEIGELADNFQRMVDNLRGMVEGVRDMTNSVSASAEELSAGAEQTTKAIEHVTVAIQDVAEGSEQQLRGVENGAGSVVQMTRKAEDVSEQMQEVTRTMSETRDSANLGALAVASTEEKMWGIHHSVEELAQVVLSLSERAEHIGDIIKVIAGISQQTNLLALNASIEAARAGEQGRGFAVVASEVRKLAEGSQQSSDQIRELIGQIQEEMTQATSTMEEVKERVTKGMEAVEKSGRSFGQIRESVVGAAETIATASATMGAVVAEASEVEQVIGHIRILSEETAGNTETISAAAEEQLASLEEMASSSTDLSSMAEQLQQLVGQFKI
ncbi:methyl-accepting chemotaxis protein [Fontibacillus sp. BL9]|uniref:methyl-accepting chemotaxis protein n=1 Tax=Fontibacillus sp. BL9 TaxID=3389971 RepID=UPI00397B4E2E